MDSCGLDPSKETQAEAGLRALIESTDDVIWSVDLSFGLVAFTRAFHDHIERTFGVLPAVGMRTEDLLPPERAALLTPAYNRTLSEGSFRVEFTLLRGPTLEMVFNPIRQDGKTTGISVFGKDITERKVAESALRDAEQRYREIVDGALEGIYQTSIDGRGLAANPAILKMLGYDSEEQYLSEMTDSAHQVWLDPSERARFTALLEERGSFRGFECRLKRKDGAPIWVSLNGRKVPGAEGRAPYYAGFIEDITERKRAEEKLRESERRIRAVLEKIELVGVMLDRDGNITLCNEYLLALTGWKRDEVLHRNWFEIFLSPEICSRISHQVSLKAIRSGEIPEHYQNEIVTRTGERRLVAWNNTVIRDAGGQVVEVASVGEDITARVEAENKLRRSEELHRSILQTAMDGFWLVDLQGRLLEVNDAYCRMSGYSAEELLTMSIADLDANETDHETAARIQTVMLQGGNRFESQHRHKDGSVFDVENCVQHRPTGSGRLAVFLRDITGRKRAEEKLRRYSADLAETNEDLKRFTQIVSHDLRAPLVNLQGFSTELRLSIDTLRKSEEGMLVNLPEPARTAVARALQETIPEALGFIENSVTRMDRLTAALLRLSRASRRELHMEELDVVALVQEVVGSLAHQIQNRNVALEIGQLPRITIDRVAIEQIFGNLLDNAIKYSDPHRPALIEVSAVETADAVVFRVRDTGRGIAEDDMARVFQPFRRLGSQDIPGEGMGLAFVRMLVHRLGGRIECHSRLGVGTTFSIMLPKMS